MNDPQRLRAVLFVAEDFVAIPGVHKLLPNGKYLENGMNVLLENPRLRPIYDVESARKIKIFEMMRDARWCAVSQLEASGNRVVFVGVYSDGTKMTRTVNISSSWIVTHDSLDRLRLGKMQADQKNLQYGGVRHTESDYTYGQHIEGGKDYTPEMMQAEAEAANALGKSGREFNKEQLGSSAWGAKTNSGDLTTASGMDYFQEQVPPVKNMVEWDIDGNRPYSEKVAEENAKYAGDHGIPDEDHFK